MAMGSLEIARAPALAIGALLAFASATGTAADLEFDHFTLVNSNTKIPGRNDNFHFFSEVVTTDDSFAFIGGNADYSGVFIVGTDGIKRVVSTADLVPAVGATLTHFEDLAFDGNTVAFEAFWFD